jgi:hypothetical protein
MPPFNPMDYACWGYGQGPYGAPPSPIPQGVYGEHGQDIADQPLKESQPAAAPREPTPSRPRKVNTSQTKMLNFGTHEDVNLVNSWLEVSCDPIINTGQRKERLWNHILVQYNTKRGSYPECSARLLQSRWESIKAEVSKFCNFYDEVLHTNRSGFSDADKVLQADTLCVTCNHCLLKLYW